MFICSGSWAVKLGEKISAKFIYLLKITVGTSADNKALI